MSGEVIPYTCSSRGGSTKFLRHRNRIEEKVLDHLGLDKKNYIVKLIHDDDDEKLQQEHNTRIEKWKNKGKHIISYDNYILPGIYDDSTLRVFKEQRDKNRCYKDGSIVRAFVQEFNLNRAWEELKDDN
jgi:hypothetical protein